MAEIHKLKAKQVKSLPAGKHGDGGGLTLVKQSPEKGQWILRVSVNGKRREMGLGGAFGKDAVSLADARTLASDARAKAKAGFDPIKEREREQRAARQVSDTFREVALDCFNARKVDLKEDGQAGRWFSPIELHVLPNLGNTPVTEIDQIAIRDCLRPIWHSKAHTAQKAVNRTGIILKHAAALGFDVNLNAVPNARALLGSPRHKTQNIPALHWKDVPDFFASLNEGSIVHSALRLLILTGVRSKPLRFMRWEHVAGDTWTIPAALMKGRAGKVSDFRVPLSKMAIETLAAVKPFERDGFVFPSVRRGVISDAAMSRLMQRRGIIERPHGFRTSLRTWLADCSDAPWHVAETCLSHVVGSDVERAYQRSDYLEQRRQLLERWASHCVGESSAKVIEIKR